MNLIGGTAELWFVHIPLQKALGFNGSFGKLKNAMACINGLYHERRLSLLLSVHQHCLFLTLHLLEDFKIHNSVGIEKNVALALK